MERSELLKSLNLGTYMPSLSLPLPPCDLTHNDAADIYSALDEMLRYGVVALGMIQTNLSFWLTKNEDFDTRAHFMLFERGPYHLIAGSIQLLYDNLTTHNGTMNLHNAAAAFISRRITTLSSLRSILELYVAEVYTEIAWFGADLFIQNKLESSSPTLIININAIFTRLRTLITDFDATSKLVFVQFPQVCEWKDRKTLIHQNISCIHDYLSGMILKNKKPRKINLFWVQYAIALLGVSLSSFWLIHHSEGSAIKSLIDNARNFWRNHVERRILAIKEEMFATSQKGFIESADVTSTHECLQRMLSTYNGESVGEKSTSDYLMNEMLMKSYMKKIMHPVWGLFSGDIATSLLIQLQKEKFHVERGMYEVAETLKKSRLTLAFFAALPLFLISFMLGILARALRKDVRAEAMQTSVHGRLLLSQIESTISELSDCLSREVPSNHLYGLSLYYIDSLYSTAKKHAGCENEWQLNSNASTHVQVKPDISQDSNYEDRYRIFGKSLPL